MRAARYYDRGDIRIDEIAEPVVTPGTVGIDVAWCGICGSDLHEYMEGPIFIPPAGHPHPISGESAPVTMGNEMSGVVYAVGDSNLDGLRLPGLTSAWEGREDEPGTLGSGTRKVDDVHGPGRASAVRRLTTPSDHQAVLVTRID